MLNFLSTSFIVQMKRTNWLQRRSHRTYWTSLERSPTLFVFIAENFKEAPIVYFWRGSFIRTPVVLYTSQMMKQRVYQTLSIELDFVCIVLYSQLNSSSHGSRTKIWRTSYRSRFAPCRNRACQWLPAINELPLSLTNILKTAVPECFTETWLLGSALHKLLLKCTL